MCVHLFRVFCRYCVIVLLSFFLRSLARSVFCFVFMLNSFQLLRWFCLFSCLKHGSPKRNESHSKWCVYFNPDAAAWIFKSKAPECALHNIQVAKPFSMCRLFWWPIFRLSNAIAHDRHDTQNTKNDRIPLHEHINPRNILFLYSVPPIARIHPICCCRCSAVHISFVFALKDERW